MKNMRHLQTLKAALCAAFVERADIVEAMIIAVIAGEHAFLEGDPGTAKSNLVRVLSQALGLSNWEYLLTKFSGPDEVFGPVMLSAMQRDSFERNTCRGAAAFQVVFLDEIWKANSAILNALLTLLNERLFHNGGVPVGCPLVTCFSASNEQPEGPELRALYDRFILRLHVERIADRGNFLTMMKAGDPSIPSIPINIAAEQAAAGAVTIGGDTYEAFADMREATHRAGFVVSDRRWKKSQKLVRAVAHMDGRTDTQPDDLSILEHSIWNEPGERHAVAKLVQTIVNPNAARAVGYFDAAKQIVEKLPKADGMDPKEYTAALGAANRSLLDIRKAVKALGSGKKIDAVLADVTRFHAQVSKIVAKLSGLDMGDA